VIDGLVSLMLCGNLIEGRHPERSWSEFLFLGVCFGMLARRGWHRTPGASLPTAGRFYVVTIISALVLARADEIVGWGSYRLVPLEAMWQSLAAAYPVPEQPLRATLIFLAGPVLVMLTRAALAGVPDQRMIWWSWLGGAFFSIIFGSWMWLYRQGTWWPRLESVFDDANSYASYLVLTVFIAWALFIREQHLTRKAVLGLLIVTTIGATLWAGSRAGGIALLVCLPLAWAVQARSTRRFRIGFAVAIAVLLLVTALSVRLPSQFATVLRQSTDPVFLAQHAHANRLHYWKASFEAFLAHPLFGLGPGLLPRNIGYYGDYRPFSGQWGAHIRENAHNYFLQLAAEVGLLGLLGFLWFLWECLYPAPRGRARDDPSVRLLLIGVIGYLFTMLSGHPLLLSRQTILFWGFVGVLSSSLKTILPEDRGFHSLWRWSPMLVVGVSGLLFAWHMNVSPCQRPFPLPGPVTWEFILGFYPAESTARRQSSHTPFRWMTDAGQLRLCNTANMTVTVDLTVRATSFAEPQTLAVYLHGQERTEVIIPATPTTVTILDVPLAPGVTDLILVATPGAQVVDLVLHNGDLRPLSILFFDPQIIISNEEGKKGGRNKQSVSGVDNHS
jgi:O-antigen ligase